MDLLVAPRVPPSTFWGSRTEEVADSALRRDMCHYFIKSHGSPPVKGGLEL